MNEYFWKISALEHSNRMDNIIDISQGAIDIIRNKYGISGLLEKRMAG